MQRLYANTMPFYTKNMIINRLFTEESWNPSSMDAKGQLYFARKTKSITSYLYLLFTLFCQMWHCRFFKYLYLCSFIILYGILFVLFFISLMTIFPFLTFIFKYLFFIITQDLQVYQVCLPLESKYQSSFLLVHTSYLAQHGVLLKYSLKG